MACLPSTYISTACGIIVWRGEITLLQMQLFLTQAAEVGVISCSVALIATESVSIVIPWLLLPPEVGVNRHGQNV